MAPTQKNQEKQTPQQQRDRFVAFAFASADLFLELSPDGEIIFALGAAKTITGINDKTLAGKNWLELFSSSEHKRLQEVREKSIPGLRCGPFLVQMNEEFKKPKGILASMSLPNSDSLYITLGLSNTLMDKLAILMETDGPEALTTGFKAEDEEDGALTTGLTAEDQEDQTITTGFKAEDEEDSILTTGLTADDQEDQAITTGFKAEDEENNALTTGFAAEDDDEFDDSLYNKGEFIEEAENIFEAAKEQKIDAAVTIFDFGRTETIPEENWAEALGEISELLQSKSLDGKTAAEIGEHKYSIVHDNTTSLEKLEQKIKDISKTFDPNGEGIDISSKSIKADLDNMSTEDAARSLFYALNEFENAGEEFSIETLSTGLQTQVKDNKEKLAEFKDIIERVDFEIQFQPIAELKTGETTHFEVLSRFRSGNTLDWVMFGEDVDLCADFDLAVVERTMNYIHYKAGTTRTKFSINISAKSLNNKKFAKKLNDNLAKRDYNDRVMFEITNFNAIKKPKQLNAFIRNLQNNGYEVALDNFSTDPLALKILEKLSIDCVKIHGKHIRKFIESEKEAVKLQKLTALCKSMNIKTVAKSVENEKQAEALTSMGILYAQGFFYGKAASAPSYTPPKK